MADTRETTPILAGLVYPPHILYCPPRLIFVNMIVAAFVAIAAGFQPVVMLFTIPSIHVAIALAYMREPFLVGRAVGFWRARRFFWQRTANRIPIAGNKYVA